MILAGIQMLAPKPFRSQIGKYVVHFEIRFILGAIRFANAVVTLGSLATTTGATTPSACPAWRFIIAPRIASWVAPRSSFLPSLLALANTTRDPASLNLAFVATRSRSRAR